MPETTAGMNDLTSRPMQAGTIEINLQSVRGLFNSMDPSPFREKDLDREAEEFILSWAAELPHDVPIHLRLHISDERENPREAEAMVREAIANYFAYRASIKQHELRQLLRRGRASLLIGLAFLTVCLIGGRLLDTLSDSAWLLIVRESLLIGGWVAMWRPLEIFLYDWWPLRHRRRLFDRLAQAEVEIVPLLR